MDKDIIENDFSVKLKAVLFDIVSLEEDNKNGLTQKISSEKDEKVKEELKARLQKKNLLLNEVMKKGNDLVSTVEELFSDTLVQANNKEKKELKTEESSNSEQVINEDKTLKTSEEKVLEDAPVKIKKRTADIPKAIIVSLEQFRKLSFSKDRQKNLILSHSVKNEENNADVIPMPDLDNDNEKVEENLNLEDSPSQDNVENGEEESLEQMLERANNLYKEGNLKESQALFEKISLLNKANKELDKTLTKTA